MRRGAHLFQNFFLQRGIVSVGHFTPKLLTISVSRKPFIAVFHITWIFLYNSFWCLKSLQTPIPPLTNSGRLEPLKNFRFIVVKLMLLGMCLAIQYPNHFNSFCEMRHWNNGGNWGSCIFATGSVRFCVLFYVPCLKLNRCFSQFMLLWILLFSI